MKNIASKSTLFRPQALGLFAILLLLASCQPTAPAQGTPGAGANPQNASAQPGGPGGPTPGTGAPGGNRRSAVVPVQVETVKFAPLVVQSSAGGTVAAETQSSVAANTSGIVKSQVRKAGDWVNTGDTVVKLDDSQLIVALNIAKKNLDNARVNAGVLADGSKDPGSKLQLQVDSAQKNYDSALKLSKIGGISGSDLDTAKANLQAAKDSLNQTDLAVGTADLQVQQAQLNLQFASIKAPYAGQISAINVNPGEYVSASTAAFVMVSRSKIVTFSVPPPDAVGLAAGASISFSQNGKTYPVVLSGAPSAPVNGQVPLKAALPSNFPGAYGTVGSVVYSQVLATGVLVPLPAVQSLENSTYAFEVKNNKAVRADLTILANSGAYAAVSGIDAGAVVILNPPPGLLVGATVQVVGAASSGAAGQSPGKGGTQGSSGNKAAGGSTPGDTSSGRTGNGRRAPGSGQAAGAPTATANGSSGGQ